MAATAGRAHRDDVAMKRNPHLPRPAALRWMLAAEPCLDRFGVHAVPIAHVCAHAQRIRLRRASAVRYISPSYETYQPTTACQSMG